MATAWTLRPLNVSPNLISPPFCRSEDLLARSPGWTFLVLSVVRHHGVRPQQIVNPLLRWLRRVPLLVAVAIEDFHGVPHRSLIGDAHRFYVCNLAFPAFPATQLIVRFAISHRRLIAFDETGVTFRYKDLAQPPPRSSLLLPVPHP